MDGVSVKLCNGVIFFICIQGEVKKSYLISKNQFLKCHLYYMHIYKISICTIFKYFTWEKQVFLL